MICGSNRLTCLILSAANLSLSRAAAHYSLMEVGEGGGHPRHLYYLGSVDKRGAGAEHEGNELRGVCERVQDENNRVKVQTHSLHLLVC